MGADLILRDDWSISIREQKGLDVSRVAGWRWSSDSGPAGEEEEEEEECKDLKEVGHLFFCQDVFAVGSDSHMLPLKPRGVGGLCCGPAMCHQRCY